MPPPGRLFDRSGGQAGHVVLDEERINDRYRDRAEQRRGHKLPPIEDIAADQFGNGTDRHRTDRGVGQEDQRVEEFVLRQGEGEDAGRDESRVKRTTQPP